MRLGIRIVSWLLIVAGAIFAAQGVGVLKGSLMTGDRRWMVIGVGMLVVGLVVGRWQSLPRPDA